MCEGERERKREIGSKRGRGRERESGNLCFCVSIIHYKRTEMDTKRKKLCERV